MAAFWRLAIHAIRDSNNPGPSRLAELCLRVTGRPRRRARATRRCSHGQHARRTRQPCHLRRRAGAGARRGFPLRRRSRGAVILKTELRALRPPLHEAVTAPARPTRKPTPSPTLRVLASRPGNRARPRPRPWPRYLVQRPGRQVLRPAPSGPEPTPSRGRVSPALPPSPGVRAFIRRLP